MENGTFQPLNMVDVDFVENETPTRATRLPRMPDPEILDFKSIPRDLRKSGTVETLISQNEDLMARLKVTLRRMTTLEDENRQLQQNMKDLNLSYSSVSDQMLIWKEKEKIWKDRHNQLENELRTFQARFPDYQKLEAQVERYKRYQERVKTTIKPYLAQLKEYAAGLHSQVQALNHELNMKEAAQASLEQRMQSLKDEKDQLAHFYEMNQNSLIESFEREKATLNKELQVLNESNHALDLKSQSLDRSLERQDDLENLVVSLRRNKEDFQREIQTEIEHLRSSNRELKARVTENGLAIADLHTEREQLKAQTQSAISAREEIEEQMTSLRYMWTAKSEENEKLKISQAALEKLNFELSSKLNDLRKQN
jgi:chromosome segregation ATPase